MAYDDSLTPTVPGGDNPEADETKIEPINEWAAIEWVDGDSFYVLTSPDGITERFIRVTSPLEPVAKTALVPWAAGLAAEAAFEHLPRMVASQLIQPCGRTYKKCEHDFRTNCVDCPCRDCPDCMLKMLKDRHLAVTYRRSDEGTRFHRWAHNWVLGEPTPHEPDLQPYVDRFLQFIEDFGLTRESFEWAEAIVVNRTHGYAGTCDAGIHIRRLSNKKATIDLLDRLTADGQPRVQQALVLVDWKSREAEGRQPFQDMTLQEVGYRRAETMRMPDGSEVPMPQVDATAVVQFRPDGYDVILTRTSELEFQGFLGYLQGHRWQVGHGAEAISSRTFKFAPSVARARANDGAKARAAAKKAAKKAAPAAVAGAAPLSAAERVLGRPADTLLGEDPPF